MLFKLSKTLITTAILWLALVHGATADTHCSGSWEITVRDNGGLQQSSAGPVSWLRAEVVLEEQLGDCIGFLLIGPGNSTQWWLESGAQSLRIEPYDSRRNPLYIAEDGRGWVLPLQGDGLLHTFLLRVDHPQSTRPGVFQGIIQSEAWASRLATQPLSQQSNLIEFVVEPYVALYFDGGRESSSGSYFRVDLGELRTGSAHEFDVFINSNSDVTLEIESENHGMLVHSMDRSLSIPYDFTLDNHYLDLRTSTTLNMSRQHQRDWQIPARVSVPYVSRTARAGEYSDIISIDIYPRE
ncbi:hypothetical protein ACR0ST_07820 [Aliidiomarina sp. Khilg15.8]